MAGVFDYKRYINIFATAEDVKQTFPRDQYTLTWDFDNVGADGWTCDIDWMPLLVDRIRFINGEPNFQGSSILGYFPGSTTSTVQSGTAISLPANMYTGPLYPGQDINVPITVVNLNWYKGTLNFQRQLLLIQNWEPGTEIGNPENDPNYIPLAESYPITVDFSIDPTTVFTDTTITVVATATSAESFTISNTVSTVLVTPQFSDIPSSILTTTNFVNGEFTATFYVGDNWVEQAPRQDGVYTILTSTITTSSYSIVADITRQHPIRLRWQYDKETGYRAGQTVSKTLTVSTTRNVTYIAEPITISLAQELANVRIGNSSTFTVSHTANETEAITGLVTLSGTVFYSTATAPMPITIGTGTFNANKQCVFTAVLNTGTYTLTASYSGNIGDNIFRTMYLATVSNTITHFVAFGREFALVEMLIERTPTNDILYAHGIDDGKTTGEIGGAVTFYENGNILGTSTFVRYYYNWPVVDTTPILATKSFTTTPKRGTYPWPADPRDNGIWSNYINPGAAGQGFPQSLMNQYGISEGWPYAARIPAGIYSISDPTKPTFFATLKPDSIEYDWPPTFSKINTIGIVANDGSLSQPIVGNFSSVGFETSTVKIPIPNQRFNNVLQNDIYIELIEYLGPKQVPAYSNVPFTINPAYSSSRSSFNIQIGALNYQYNTYMAGRSTPPVYRGSFKLHNLPNYATAAPATGKRRIDGLKYFAQHGPIVNGTVQTDVIDRGDCWPDAFNTGSSPQINNLMVYKFRIVGNVKDANGNVLKSLNFEMRQPDLIENGVNKPYGYKQWYNNVGDQYEQFERTLTAYVYKVLIGEEPLSFNAISVESEPQQLVNIASRSHLATLQKPANSLSTTSIFTATFGGTLDRGIENYFNEGIPFTYSTTSTLNMADGKQFIDTFEQPEYDWKLQSISLLPSTLSTKVETDPGGLTWVGYYLNKPPTYTPQITNWLNIDSYPGSVIPIRSWVGTNIFEKQDASDGIYPNVVVFSQSTGNVYTDVLKPIGRTYATELATDYVKRVGWLNERTPKGKVGITLLDPNTLVPVNTLDSSTLTNIESTLSYVIIQSGFNLYLVDPQLNLPVPLRYNSHPYRSSNTRDNIPRLDLLGIDSYTTATTATVVYPVRMDYIPSSQFLQPSTQNQYVLDPPNSPTNRDMKVSFLWNRGTSIKFKSNNPAYLQTPPVQRYLVHSAVYDLPYANNYGDSVYGVKWSSVNPQGYVASIILGNNVGRFPETLTNYRIRVPTRNNDQVLFWFHRWSVERWSADGSTLLGTYSPPEFARLQEFTEIYDNSLNPSQIQVDLYPTGVNSYRSGYVIYNSYGETGVVVNTPPSPTFGPYLYKIYVELHCGGLTGFARNQFTGNEYYTTRIPTTNGLVRKNAEWHFETNFGNAFPDVPGKITTPLFQLQTLTPTGYQDIYTNNEVL